MGVTSLLVFTTVYTVAWYNRDNDNLPMWDFMIQEEGNMKNSNLRILNENLMLWFIPFTFIFLLGYVIQYTKHYMSQWKLNPAYPLFYPSIVKEILRSFRGIIIASLLEIYMSNYSSLYSTNSHNLEYNNTLDSVKVDYHDNNIVSGNSSAVYTNVQSLTYDISSMVSSFHRFFVVIGK